MKKRYLILDTETGNNMEDPLVYDLGYVITDNEGRIYKSRSFVVKEIFIERPELFQNCYYADKLDRYYYNSKEWEVASLWKIRKEILRDLEKYNIDSVGAYNVKFDHNALDTTVRYLSKSLCRFFFPLNTKFFCIWNMACHSLLARPSYFKFAEENGLLKESGNLETTAEACYKFITKKADFEEAHSGLADVLIEKEIFVACLKTHKKQYKEVDRMCWYYPQKVRKARKTA